MSIEEALKQEAKLAEMLKSISYIEDEPNPSKAKQVADKLRQRPQLLFDLLAELGKPKIASAWIEIPDTPPVWRRLKSNGDSVATVLHAHPDDPEGSNWHALVPGKHVAKGWATAHAARVYVDQQLLVAGYTLLGGPNTPEAA